MLLIDTGIFVSGADRNEPWAHDTIATLNHRDFAVVRPTHRDAFNLIP